MPLKLTCQQHTRACLVQEQGTEECDGCWDESFLSHQDTKPKGPQGLSLDVTFPGAGHVYGLPERATSLALKPTTGGEHQPPARGTKPVASSL